MNARLKREENTKDGMHMTAAEEGDLRNYNVRLPKEIRDKLPQARILTGKRIQDLVREALEEKLHKIRLL